MMGSATTTSTLKFSYVLVLLCFSLSVLLCEAKPLLLITSPTPKCIYVEVPEETQVQVKVDSLDLPKSATKKKEGRSSPVQALHSSHVSIEQPGISKSKVRELTEIETTVDFVAYVSGVVQACITANSASPKNVMRFGIAIKEVYTNEIVDSTLEEQYIVEEHLSRLEASVDVLRRELKAVLKEASFSREREAAYFEEIISMNQESGWWPILHLFVLIFAGFMQAQHIVSFFRNKHLI